MAVVSVVVPCYKVETYLPELADSLLSQTLRDLQIILVDDGSPDRTGAICDAYAAKDSRVTVIHKPNGGVSAARNDGLSAATAPWVIFCDSDDTLPPDALERLVSRGEETGADVVFGDVELVYPNRTEQAVFYKDEFATDDRAIINKLIQANFYKYYCYNPPAGGPAFGYGGPWNKLVRRALLQEHHIQFDTTVGGIFDDLIFTAYIFACATKVAYTHATVYRYRQLEGSITHSYKDNLLEINQSIFAAWEEFLTCYDRDGSFRKPYYANILRRLKASLGTHFFHKNNRRSFFAQCRQLRKLVKSQPYRDALRNLEKDRLKYKYDRLLWMAAKTGSGFGIWMVYTLFRLTGGGH